MMKILFLILFVASSAFAGNGTKHLPPSERYLPVVKQIIKFCEFLQTELIEIRKIQNRLGIKGDTVTNNLRIDLASAELFTRWGEELLSGKTSGDVILQRVLQERMDVITASETQYRVPEKRSENVETFLRLKKLIPPRYPEYDEKAISYINTRFQFMALIGKKLFEILELDELSPKTVQLVQTSVSLWPLFKGETRSLGNPLFDAGMFAIVDSYYEDLIRGLVTPDFVPQLTGAEGLSSQQVQIYTNATLAFVRLIGKEVSPTWENKKLRIDSEIYKNHFIYNETFIPFLGLGLRKNLPPAEKYKHGIIGIANAFEAGFWKEPLPDPDFLHPEKTSVQQAPVSLGATFFETFPFEKLEIEEEEKEDVPVVVPAAAALPEPTKESVPVLEEKASPLSKAKEHVVASGIRKFHALMPSSDYAEQNLSSSKQKLVDDFFDPRKLNTMTYGKFRALWLYLGGRIEEDHGSSHKLLIGPRGEALFGVYAHGDSQTYSPKTIKYLRTALWHIGCRPQE